MGLETGTYPSFIGGVSQQDDTVRSPNQVAEAVNTWLHAAMGTGKRPPAAFCQVLASDLDPQSHFHSIVRDEVEQYVVAVGNRSIRVFDHETGKEYDVVPTEGSLDYLETYGRQPWSVYKTATVADTTFIVNRNVVVEMDEESASPGWLYGSAQTLADLPKSAAPVGSIYHVRGTAESPFDDYYVQRSSENVYVECGKPGIPFSYKSGTMPHILKRIPDPVHADGFWFTFGPPAWEVRIAGDASSSPPASIVGDCFREVFLHKNRLGFLGTENILMSETDNLFNLWRTSVTQMLDSDPIDIAVPTNGVASLSHAIPFQSAVYITGANGHYLLTAEPYMSPRNAKIDVVSSYASSKYVRPILLGDSLYIVDDNGEYACVREYFMDDLSVTGDAADVTAHVPRYLPGRARCVTAAVGGDCLLVGMESGDVYAYFVRWAGDEKAQSAWARWRFSGVGKVVHMHTIHDRVYVIAEAPGGGCEMLRVDLMLNADDADATTGYHFLLDRLAVIQPYYRAFGNYTEITLPYVLESLDGVSVVKTDDWADAGAYLDIQGAYLVDGGTTIRLPGNRATGRVAVGLNYETYVELTRPILRNRDGSAILVGRTQVRDLEVAYRDAAYFEVEVHSKGTGRKETFLASHAHAYTARVLDDSQFSLSTPSFHSGSRRFPVLSNADNVRIRLVNRLPYQCWWQSAQWRGMFVSRSRT